MKAIIPGLYNFSGLRMGRVFLSEDPDGLTLIDAGLPLAAEKILAQIATHGHQPQDIKRILITHAHPDHIGGLPALKEATGAAIYASATERPYVEGKEAAPRPPRESLSGINYWIWREGTIEPGTPVDHALEDGDVIPEVMGGLQVVATPGHSPGHISFWQPEKRVLFVGDVVMALPRLGPPIAAFTWDMARNKRSLQRLVELNPAVACLGHGEPLQQGATEKLRGVLAHA